MTTFAGRECSGATACVLAVLTLASVAATAAAQTRAAVNDGVQQLAEKAASGRWDRFSAHIIVKRGWISSAAAGGLAVRPPVLPADLIDEYVWERARTVNGWHTTVTLVAATAGSVQTSTGRVSLPLDRAVRMEDAEDGTAPKFFDRDGVPLLPSSAPAWERFTAMTRTPQGTVALDGAPATARGMTGPFVRPGAGREWVNALVLSPAQRSERVSRLERQFGPRAGWVRGYGQYLKTSGARSVEVLVDEQDGVPVEANVAEQGRLQTHTTFAYERAASGALMRKSVRLEQAWTGDEGLPGAGANGSTAAAAIAGPSPQGGTARSDGRIVTEVTFEQVQLSTAPKGGLQ